MICPHCAFPNDSQASFCVKCKRPLDRQADKASPAAGSIKTPGWLRAPVSGPPAPASKPTPAPAAPKAGPGKSTARPTAERVTACLADAQHKEETGDLRGAFLVCQSLLIDHYGDIPDQDMASLYLCMSRVSLKQGKLERALKYLKKARTLSPKDPRIAALMEQLTPAAAAAPSTPAKTDSIPPVPAPIDDMPTPDETDSGFVIKEKISEIQPVEQTEAPPAAPPAAEPEPVSTGPIASPDGRLVWVSGFWVRLAAFLVDMLVVSVVVVAMMFISSLILGHGAMEAFDFFFQQVSTLLAASSVYVLLLLVYITLFTIYGGQTAGKMLLGLRVVGLDGHSVTAPQALRRAGGMLIAGLPGLAGFLWTAFDLQRRGWHDYIGGTLVVHICPREMKAALSRG